MIPLHSQTEIFQFCGSADCYLLQKVAVRLESDLRRLRGRALALRLKPPKARAYVTVMNLPIASLVIWTKSVRKTNLKAALNT
jgi:hypothetical protein